MREVIDVVLISKRYAFSKMGAAYFIKIDTKIALVQ